MTYSERETRKHEVEEIEVRSTPPTPVIYDVVCKMGEEEMERPATSLWWSGFAAGLSISSSLLAQAILLTHLPDAAWRPLLTSFGYRVGFVMVVLSRQQLFTENTITVVLPVMARPSLRSLGLMARLWSIVLLANLAGTLFSAAFPPGRTGRFLTTRHGARNGAAWRLAPTIASVTFPLLRNRLCLRPAISREGTSYVNFFAELALSITTDIAFVALVRLDQFSWHFVTLAKGV